MKKTLISLVVIVGILIAILFIVPAFLGVVTSDIPPVNDMDIRLSTVPAPKRDNAYYDLVQLDGALDLSEAENSTINAMLEDGVKDPGLAKKLVEKNALALQYFGSASKRSLLQNPDTADVANIKIDMALPNLNDWRQAANLYALQAMLHAEQGNNNLAFQESLNIARVGHRILNSQDSLITYLVGIGIKQKGLKVLQKVASSTSISNENLNLAMSDLHQFKQNKVGYDNALKMEYLIFSEGIDDIALGIATDSQDNSVDDFGRIDNLFYFQPNATKQLYSEWIKAYLAETDCSAVPSVMSEDSRIDNVVEAFFTENAIGKILFDVRKTSLSGVAKKRCSDLDLVEQTREILEEKMK